MEDGARAPLLLYLHGAGGKGDDPERLLGAGLPRLLEQGELALPFWVLAPQSPASRSGWPIDLVAELLEAVAARDEIDASRVYATGTSMGGRGLYELAYDYSPMLAAIAPLCAFGIPTLAPRLANLPVWAFHGADDDIVPLARGLEMADALSAAGCANHFTVLEHAGHNIEREVYLGRPALWEWFKQQQRRSAE
ncbi:carboxylesterase family protein [Paenibacillus koleovorans]|uniref:carboxylesterase family protein n=1 Tax=Paenibacillus koleovorans TaxID=121608 RepID=UPI0013E29A0E|nr:dienelactone hydrolase family protein [Paenibacillus koleovorans]